MQNLKFIIQCQSLGYGTNNPKYETKTHMTKISMFFDLWEFD